MNADFALLQSSVKLKLDVDAKMTYFLSFSEYSLYGTNARSPIGLASAFPGRPSWI